MNRLAITNIELDQTYYTAYLILNENRDVIDFQVFEPEELSILNNIYIARVENIVSNIHAAFVRINNNQRCFLSFEELKTPIFTKKQSLKKDLSIGDELLVQVTRDAVKTKDPVVSSKLTLSGKYAVLTSDNTNIGISKKISNEQKQSFTQIVEECIANEVDRSFGIVIRTNAIHASSEELTDDIKQLIVQYKQICITSIHKNAFSLIYRDEPGYIVRLKGTDFSKIDYVYTDVEKIASHIQEALPRIADKVILYNDTKLSLNALYNINGNVEKLLSNKVWLKSGANIIIESLETLTVIDINTGKNITKQNNVILNVNKEAAIEIARQLRLRNISGMIIIDFINMNSTGAESELLNLLKQEIAKDPVRCSFIDITKLGLVELTRKKQYRSLKETIQTNAIARKLNKKSNE